jgi:hypothetical protein
MAKRTWSFEIDGKLHDVRLDFGLIPGRQIWLDGNLINKGRNTLESGSEYHFAIDNQPVELGIVSTPAGYDFYLRVQNKFISARENSKQKIRKQIVKKFEERQKWIDIGREYGLEYVPMPLTPYVFQHRLIGYIDDFLVLVSVASKSSGENSIPGYYLLIRHAPIDPEKEKEIKNNDEIKTMLKDVGIQPGWLELNPGLTTLFINSGNKKDVQFESLECLLSCFRTLARNLRPSMAGKCEGAYCTSRFYQDLTLTVVNGYPYAMCQSCIDSIDSIGKRAKEEYKQQPNNLLKGSLYGLGAAAVGAIVWALVFIFLDRIGAAFAIFIFFMVAKAMDYAKTKRSFLSLFIASLISLLGSIAGTYLGIAGYLLKEGKLEPTWSEIFDLAKFIIENPEIMNDTILFALVGLVPYLFLIWNANRKNLSMYFKPEVELVKNFELRRQ